MRPVLDKAGGVIVTMARHAAQQQAFVKSRRV